MYASSTSCTCKAPYSQHRFVRAPPALPPLQQPPLSCSIRETPSIIFRSSSCANVVALRCICRQIASVNAIRKPYVVRLLALQRGCSFPSRSLAATRHGTYLMVLPVRRRIHCGMGRFCFCAFASLVFVRKDLWLYSSAISIISHGMLRKSAIPASWAI